MSFPGAIVRPEYTARFNAAQLATLAKHAYHDDVSPVRQAWPNVLKFRRHNAQGLIAWDQSDLAIAIAGTNDINDVLADLNVRSSWDAGGLRAHAGFSRYADRVRLAIWGINARLPKAWGETHRVWVTGHSLGGAAAQILPFLDPRLNPHLIVTFGSPRAWSRRAAALAASEYHIVNICGAYDIVPLLPRRFHHASAPLWLCGPGDLRSGWTLCGALKRAWRRLSLSCSGLSQSIVEDHAIGSYEFNLKERE